MYFGILKKVKIRKKNVRTVVAKVSATSFTNL